MVCACCHQMTATGYVCHWVARGLSSQAPLPLTAVGQRMLQPAEFWSPPHLGSRRRNLPAAFELQAGQLLLGNKRNPGGRRPTEERQRPPRTLTLGLQGSLHGAASGKSSPKKVLALRHCRVRPQCPGSKRPNSSQGCEKRKCWVCSPWPEDPLALLQGVGGCKQPGEQRSSRHRWVILPASPNHSFLSSFPPLCRLQKPLFLPFHSLISGCPQVGLAWCPQPQLPWLGSASSCSSSCC